LGEAGSGELESWLRIELRKIDQLNGPA
jgi:hypothetical protein